MLQFCDVLKVRMHQMSLPDNFRKSFSLLKQLATCAHAEVDSLPCSGVLRCPLWFLEHCGIAVFTRCLMCRVVLEHHKGAMAMKLA